MSVPLDKAATLAATPSPAAADPLALVRAQLARSPAKLVVLDDDPTGTQTVRDVPVLTRWEAAALEQELRDPSPCVYLLTNSRSLADAATRALHAEVAAALSAASRATGRPVVVVSRGDSTLRGHFPAETDALAAGLGGFDGVVIFPYFEAGGRLSIDDVHYVAEGDRLVPCADTPFARDAAFGYRSSDLRAWVEEKTAGRIRAAEVVSISLQDLRGPATADDPGGVAGAVAKLRGLRGGAVAVVNACQPRDAHAFALASLQAEAAGARLLYRTAAQFVAARIGQAPGPLWRPAPGPSSVGGLMVVGSYVPKTTEQLARLREAALADFVELDAGRILREGPAGQAVQAARAEAERALASGRDVIVATSRVLITGDSAESSLDIGNAISRALVALVQGLARAPRFLVAKGGITSSDLATAGLGVRRARVLGQILPGVPVWETGPETRFPGLPYIVFPGNVGGPDALIQTIQALSPTSS